MVDYRKLLIVLSIADCRKAIDSILFDDKEPQESTLKMWSSEKNVTAIRDFPIIIEEQSKTSIGKLSENVRNFFLNYEQPKIEKQSTV